MEKNTSVLPVEVYYNPTLPLAAIIIFATSGYILFVTMLLFFRKCLKTKGYLQNCCADDYNCNYCYCCQVCAEACDCKVPTLDHCLDAICPSKEQCNCESLWRACSRCAPPCQLQTPNCSEINCGCCQVSFKSPS